MIIRKLAIPRRTVLRGMGTVLALPFLDAMVPAFARAQAVRGPRRLGIVYVPNGMAMDYWTPAAEGAGYEMTPVLQPLEKHRNTITVVSGLTQASGKSDSGAHSRAASKFLTGYIPERNRNSELKAGISMDQVVAKEFGRETQLASLEVGLDVRDSAGSCAEGLCAYTTTISWRDETIPLPMEPNPRVVFEQLFGDSDSTDPAARLARIRNQKSILDSIMQKVADLSRDLGAGGRGKLEQYLDAVRDVERRIEKAEVQSASNPNGLIEQPGGVPSTFAEHINLMFDLQILAYQADLTRVVTLMVGRETSGRSYPEIGVPDAHHPLSHHGDDPQVIARMSRINAYHTHMFSGLLDKMQATADGEGSLLDNTLFLYGAGMSNSNVHAPEGLPLMLAGGSGGQHKGGRHIVCPSDTPVANLHLTILDMLGVRTEKFGESTGQIEPLSI
jgi:hypothetical protein